MFIMFKQSILHIPVLDVMQSHRQWLFCLYPREMELWVLSYVHIRITFVYLKVQGIHWKFNKMWLQTYSISYQSWKLYARCYVLLWLDNAPDSKVHGANLGSPGASTRDGKFLRNLANIMPDNALATDQRLFFLIWIN